MGGGGGGGGGDSKEGNGQGGSSLDPCVDNLLKHLKHIQHSS